MMENNDNNVRWKDFTPVVADVSALKKSSEFIKEQVSNHLPTQIKEMEKSVICKIDDIMKSNSLYLDNKVNSHTRDVLDDRYALKSIEQRVRKLQEDKITQGIFYWKYGIIWTAFGTAFGILLYKLFG